MDKDGYGDLVWLYLGVCFCGRIWVGGMRRGMKLMDAME